MFVRIVEENGHVMKLRMTMMITTSCVALSVARIWSILIQVVLMIMLVMLVGVDGMGDDDDYDEDYDDDDED